MKLSAVIFDLDGVLVSTDKQHYEAWSALCNRLDISFSRADYRAFRGVSRTECMNLIERMSGGTFSPDEKLIYADWKNEYYRMLLNTLTPDDVQQTTRCLLNALRERKFALAVGSSSRNARYILQRIRLIDAFEVIVDGTNIIHSKPNPEVFLKAAAALKRQPEACVVVEDAAAGIQAAQLAGMVAVAIGDAAENGLGNAQIRTLAELSDLLGDDTLSL